MAHNLRRSKRLKKQNADTPTTEEDLISWLPDDINYVIASRLGIKDLVSLSAVSKQWMHSWRRSLHLDFDAAIINNNRDPFILWPSRAVTPENYISWVNQVINSNEWQEIDSFRISHWLRDRRFAADITGWLQFAFAMNARRIIIDLGSDGRFGTDVHSHYTIPEEIFKGQAERLLAVEKLRLACCDIQHSKIIFSSMTALTTLSLDRVLVKQQMVDDILSLCLNLKELSLRKCECIGPLMKFNTPHQGLQHLHVSCATRIVQQIEIEGLTNLTSLECFTYTLKGPFLNSHPRIQKLSLLSSTAYRWIGVGHYYQFCHSKRNVYGNWFYNYILYGGLASDVPTLETFRMCTHIPRDCVFPEILPTFEKLRHLTLLEGDAFPEGFIKFLNCLFTMSPLLHTLEIRLCDKYKVRLGEKRLDKKVYKKRQDPLESLKVIKIYNFKRRCESIDLVAFLLKNAVNLEVLEIDRRNRWYEEDGEWMIEKVRPDINTEEVENLFYEAINRHIDLIVV